MPSGLKPRLFARLLKWRCRTPIGAGCGYFHNCRGARRGERLASERRLAQPPLQLLTHSIQIDSLGAERSLSVKTEVSIEYCVV